MHVYAADAAKKDGVCSRCKHAPIVVDAGEELLLQIWLHMRHARIACASCSSAMLSLAFDARAARS